MDKGFNLRIDERQFDDFQLNIIEQGKDLGFTMEQLGVYADSNFSWKQMYELQQGFLDGLSVQQVESYADANLSPEEMAERRKELLQLQGIKETRDGILKDSNVEGVINILMENGMEEEAKDYLSALTQVDILSCYVENQGRDISNLKNQVKEINNSSLRNKAVNILDEVKSDFNELRSRIDETIKEIKDGSKLLFNTFKFSGKIAFCKAFEKFAGKLKESFEKLKEVNSKKIDKRENRVGKINELQEELRASKTHRQNFFRVLAGKQPKDIDQNKNNSLLLKSVMDFFEKGNHLSKKVDSICDKCIKKFDKLERSFKKLTRENKKDLKNLISDAETKRVTGEKAKTHQKETEKGR